VSKINWFAWPDPPILRPPILTSLQKYKAATGDFWTEDGVEIWAPTPDLEKMAVEREGPNILSMVLKISYKGKLI
jgi:hypothetical protein